MPAVIWIHLWQLFWVTATCFCLDCCIPFLGHQAYSGCCWLVALTGVLAGDVAGVHTQSPYITDRQLLIWVGAWLVLSILHQPFRGFCFVVCAVLDPLWYSAATSSHAGLPLISSTDIPADVLSACSKMFCLIAGGKLFSGKQPSMSGAHQLPMVQKMVESLSQMQEEKLQLQQELLSLQETLSVQENSQLAQTVQLQNQVFCCAVP